MSLSSELVKEFAKITKDTNNNQASNETTIYGTTVMYDGRMFVKLDGSDLLTPVNTTADTAEDERVTVLIKNHTATITGNMSSPAARTDDVKDVANQITEFEILMAYKVTTQDLEAVNATIESLRAKIANIDNLEALNADINNLQAKYAELQYVDAEVLKALNADIESLEAKFGEFKDLSAEDLEAINADINNLKAYNADFTYVSADVLEAIKASIKELDVKKLSATEADLKYAQIDFSNIGEAAIEHFYATSGLIKDVVIENGVITGEIVGVTIRGDLIEGGTVVADKLVIRGEDGLYYKLNSLLDGVTAEQLSTEEYQSGLHGDNIIANTITAEKVNVDDLVAFDATIGGFNITDNSLYSGVKASVDNSTQGIYLDKEGQVAFGDGNQFIKYYKTDDGTFKLDISVSDLKIGSSNKTFETIIGDIKDSIENIETTGADIKVGARNLIRNSTNMLFVDYYFYDPSDYLDVDIILDENGNTVLDKEGNSLLA